LWIFRKSTSSYIGASCINCDYKTVRTTLADILLAQTALGRSGTEFTKWAVHRLEALREVVRLDPKRMEARRELCLLLIGHANALDAAARRKVSEEIVATASADDNLRQEVRKFLMQAAAFAAQQGDREWAHFQYRIALQLSSDDQEKEKVKRAIRSLTRSK